MCYDFAVQFSNTKFVLACYYIDIVWQKIVFLASTLFSVVGFAIVLTILMGYVGWLLWMER